LLIALVLLIVMTLLGLASIRSTSMQERMGANMFDRNLAFQAVESALREAESTITVTTVVSNSSGLYCPPNGTPPTCAVSYASGGETGGSSTTSSAATESSESSESSSGTSASYLERWNDPATQWRQATTWWNNASATTKSRLGSNRVPEYIIEYMGDFEDGTGCGKAGNTSCKGPRFRVTARMPPVDNMPNVVLQTSYRP
jgi:type IV pilus assembly protein PilX